MILKYLIFVSFIFSQSSLNQKVTIDFEQLTTKETLVKLFTKCNSNYIISQSFEEFQEVNKSYSNKSLKFILNDLSRTYLFIYEFSDNLFTIK